MSDDRRIGFRAAHQAGIRERLAREGLPEDVAEALMAFDSAIFLWHRMALKGEVPSRLVAELDLGLEPSQFFALTAVTRIECGIGRAGPEAATVGLLAEEMAIDPSRASRIASDLIAQGFLRREADQTDGRRTFLKLTDRALAVLAAFRDLKWSKLLEIFGDWEDEEIRCFSRLFERYVDGVRKAYGLGCQRDPDA